LKGDINTTNKAMQPTIGDASAFRSARRFPFNSVLTAFFFLFFLSLNPHAPDCERKRQREKKLTFFNQQTPYPRNKKKDLENGVGADLIIRDPNCAAAKGAPLAGKRPISRSPKRILIFTPG
jgi:hypothetical protein